MNKLFKALAIIMPGIAVSSMAVGQDYDLVIKNGRVMDPETNFDQVANVGIKRCP